MSTDFTFATDAVRAGINVSPDGAVTPPVHLTSTFAWEGIEQPRPFDYSRTANPTRNVVQDSITELEGGAGTVMTSSGMSAITVALSLLGSQDVLVFPHDAYGGTWRLVNAWAERGRFKVHTTDLTSPSAVAEIAELKPAMVWVETPSNPLLRITDIAAISAATHAVGGKVCVDNTLLSPGWQSPFEHGADVIVHSATKYLAGHSDVVAGAVVCASAELAEEAAWWANCLGVTASPFDGFLTLRGIRTLPLRLAQHGRNAEAVVEACLAHPGIEKVYYPGLATGVAADVVAKQQRHPGALISVELKGGVAGAKAFADASKLFTLAVSLGGVESLLNHPATMTHAAMTPEAQELAGISAGLLRLSVGVEDTQDLVRDVVAAADAAFESCQSGVSA